MPRLGDITNNLIKNKQLDLSAINEIPNPDKIELNNFINAITEIKIEQLDLVSPSSLPILTKKIKSWLNDNHLDISLLNQYMNFVGKQSDEKLELDHSIKLDIFSKVSTKDWVTCTSMKLVKSNKYPDQSYGWKLHVSIAYECLNEAVNIIESQNDISMFKYSNNTSSISNSSQSGKTITIYLFYDLDKTISEISKSINNITAEFIKKKLKPGDKIPDDSQIENNEFFYVRNDLACGIFYLGRNFNEYKLLCLVDKDNIAKQIDEIKNDEVLYRIFSGYSENIRTDDGKTIFDFKYTTGNDRHKRTEENVEALSKKPHSVGGNFPLKFHAEKKEFTACLANNWSQLLFPKNDLVDPLLETEDGNYTTNPLMSDLSLHEFRAQVIHHLSIKRTSTPSMIQLIENDFLVQLNKSCISNLNQSSHFKSSGTKSSLKNDEKNKEGISESKNPENIQVNQGVDPPDANASPSENPPKKGDGCCTIS